MKKAFKCLMSSILIFAMVVTTGISSKAAEFKDGEVMQREASQHIHGNGG